MHIKQAQLEVMYSLLVEKPGVHKEFMLYELVNISANQPMFFCGWILPGRFEHEAAAQSLDIHIVAGHRVLALKNISD